LDGKTPHEALTKQPPNLSNLPEWGTHVWVHDTSNTKLGGRGREGRWVGFDNDSTHAHRIFIPEKRSVIVERSVIFNSARTTETQRPDNGDNNIVIPVPIQGESTKPITEDNRHRNDLNPVIPENPEPAEKPQKRICKASAYINRLQSGEGTTQGTYRSGKRIGKDLPSGISELGALGEDETDDEDLEIEELEFAMAAAISSAEALDPKSLEEAKEQSDWPMWEEAIRKELKSLKDAKTWTLIERPPGKNIVGCKWVFRIKKNSAGEIEKYKARLVARGFTQIYGVDYTETFAPVAKMASIRTILAIAARNDWPIEVFDFNSAFLNGELGPTEDIYMQQPPGFEINGSNTVAKLRKAIYGLKQGGRTWYESLRHALTEIGFKRAESDYGVFYLHKGDEIILLAIHVDDCAITGTSQRLLDEYKKQINAKYAMTDLSEISWLQGIEVKRDRDR